MILWYSSFGIYIKGRHAPNLEWQLELRIRIFHHNSHSSDFDRVIGVVSKQSTEYNFITLKVMNNLIMQNKY